MTVYVDEAIDHGVMYGSAGPAWCHMTADSLEELHAFAAKLGLKRAYFQGPPKHKDFPHYDLTCGRKPNAKTGEWDGGKRAQAVAMGARQLQRLELLGHIRYIRSLYLDGVKTPQDYLVGAHVALDGGE